MRVCDCGHHQTNHVDSGWPKYEKYCNAFTCCDRDPSRRDSHDFISHQTARCDCEGGLVDPTAGAPAVTAGPEPTATLALCKWLRDRIKGWEDDAKAALGMAAGERKSAAVDGRHLGFVTLTKGRKTAKVVDEAALLRFVATHYPTELEQQVRPAFRDRLIKEVLSRGALLDPDGVVTDDVIEVQQGDPYPMTKLDDAADQVMSELLALGRLGENGIKAINPTTEGQQP